MNISKLLPHDIIFGLAMYYANRGLKVGINKQEKSWNKKEDLERIDKACAKHKFKFCASAGTFWFVHKHSRKLIYVVNENTFPLAKIEKRNDIINKFS